MARHEMRIVGSEGAMNLAASRFLRRDFGLWPALAILIALIAGTLAAEPLLIQFSPYDDEGYMLISMANYGREGHLYTQTFSQYGPFYFYAQGLFFQLLHLPVNHDMGRLVTLLYWVSSGLLAAVIVYRFSRSVVLASAAGVSLMLAARVLANEPGHPQQVLLLLYLVAAALSLPSRLDRHYLRFFLLGCVGAALIFTKINVGVFYLAGLAHALLCLLPSSKFRCAGLGLTLTYAAVAPLLLMHGSFDLGFRNYCLVATAAGIATFASGAAIRASERLPINAALCAAAGLLTATVAIVVATSVQGLALSSLIWGVILNPLHHPDVFHILLAVGWLNVLTALALAVGVIVLAVYPERIPVGAWWFEITRIVVGIGSLLLLILRYRIPWVAPFLPLTLIPRSRWENDKGMLFTRLFITFMAATQFLEAYPVAGSQTGIAAAPMILWAFICIADATAGLRRVALGPFQNMSERFRVDSVIGGALLLLLAGISVGRAVNRPFPAAAAGLKGADWLHLPPEQATRFEAIAGNVGANCKILFTLPGMASFNLWSGVPTPNGWNLTAWMKGIDHHRQEEILALLKSNPQACAIANRRIMRFWNKGDTSAESSPLARYILREMTKMDSFGEYEIRINPQRGSRWREVANEARARRAE